MADGNGAAPAAGDAGAAATGAGADAGAAAGTGGAQAPGAGVGTGAGTAAVAATAAEIAAWHGELTPEDMGWLQTKAWFGLDVGKSKPSDGFPAMVKAQRSLESMMGRNRLAVPKDAADAEGWNNVWATLGRPADPAGYELKVGEGGDQKIADTFAKLAHETGLTKNQVQALAPKWDAFARETASANAAAAEQTYMNNSTAEFEGLKQEWGSQADHRFAAAQRAKVTFGLEPATMDKIERAIGTKEFVTLLSNVGSAISEDGGAGAALNHGGNIMTAEMAKARISELSKDSLWQEKYRAGDTEAVAEKRKLDQVLAAAMG